MSEDERLPTVRFDVRRLSALLALHRRRGYTYAPAAERPPFE
jgi:hypothetical protein